MTSSCLLYLESLNFFRFFKSSYLVDLFLHPPHMAPDRSAVSGVNRQGAAQPLATATMIFNYFFCNNY